MKDRLVNVSAGLLASTLTLIAASAGEAPDWWRAKSEVVRDLTHSDLTQLVSEARTSETRDGRESMGRLYLFMRAGMEQDASHALKELKAVCPDLDNHQVASLLKALGQPGTAEVFFRQAMETPLTREEVERRVMQYQAFISHEQERVRFAIHAREELARCLLELKRDDEAQEQMETAQTLREEHGLGRNPLLAGTVQGASGARVIEEQIVETEGRLPGAVEEHAELFGPREGVGGDLEGNPKLETRNSKPEDWTLNADT